jgi:putative DNA primase/helicase
VPRDDLPPFGPDDEPRLSNSPPKRGKPNGAAGGPLPDIKIEAGRRYIAADQGIEALMVAKVPFYQRDMKIVRIAQVKAKDSRGETFLVPAIVSVTGAILHRALGQSANWLRHDRRTKKDVPIDPPSPVVLQIIDMAGEWPFAPLRGIIQSPTLRRDGSLLDAEGYDDATGLVLVNSLAMASIAAKPSRSEAEAALALLNGLLLEFPFVDETSRSVALSMIMTPVLRGAMEVSPMHLVTAPRPGTGKSYIADVAAKISTGERCAVQAASPNPDETEKRLIGAALAGHTIIALDNCRDILQGDFLCQLTERPLLKLRALGKSDPHLIPNTFSVFTNGNNVKVANDMVRRTIRCALDANCESPEDRAFKSNPMAMIHANRGKYVAAVLTIARAYVAADRPNRKTPVPSYEEWSAIVRDALIWLGCPDPVNTMETLRSEDPTGSERHAVFDAWKFAIGVGKNRAAFTAEIVEKAAHSPDLREALLAVAPQRFGDGKVDPKALGKWLAAQEKNIAAGCKLMVDRTNKARPKWYLELQGISRS